MLQSVFGLFLAIQVVVPPPMPDDFKDALAHAEALYYEARFKDSIQLLMRIDEQLRQSPGRRQERVATKLQLALANIGLNDFDKAKAYLRDLYDVDPDYLLDPQQFSPKVMALAVDAKKEEDQIRCRGALDDARKLIQDGRTSALVDLMASAKAKCPDISAFEPDEADLLYKRGLDAYRRSEFGSALQDFRAALKLSPKNELAAEYASLAEGKLQLTVDRLVMEWRKSFDGHQFAEAGAKYHELSTIADQRTMSQTQTAYRDALSALVDAWNRTCPTGDTVAMERIQVQIADLLPDRTFGEDIRARMTTCSKKTGSVAGRCVPTTPQIVLTRLRTRVNPEITREMRSLMRDNQTAIRVKLRIDEKGSTTVTDVQGLLPTVNTAVRTAVEKWKFMPAVDESGPRCVDTEIVVTIER
jgi:tetratricopeptide (TPR) repeat protein